MIDVERTLRRDAARIATELDRSPMRPIGGDHTVAVDRRPRHRARSGTRALAAAAAVVVALIAGIWIARGSTQPTVLQVPPVSSTVDDAVTTSAPSSSVRAQAGATALPPAEPSRIGTPLAQSDGVAGPVAIDPLPEGYVVTRTQPPDANAPSSAGSEGWRVHLFRLPAAGVASVPDYVIVSLEPVIDDDPYVGFPTMRDAPDVTIGGYVGRLHEGTPGHPVFRAVLGPWTLTAGARGSLDDLTATLAGIEVDLDAGRLDVASTPDGLDIVSSVSTSASDETQVWVVAYGRDNLISTGVAVRSTAHPAAPALVTLASPTPSTIVDVNGYTGVLNEWGLTFDVSPTFQVSVERDGFDPERNLVTDAQLLDMARDVVAVTAEQFDELTEAARRSPYPFVDLPCVTYVDVGTNAGGPVRAPGALDITIDASQPVTVTVELTSPADSGVQTRTVLATIPDITGTRSATVTWDGTVAGAPAPPGVYVLSIAAERADPAATCLDEGTAPIGEFVVDDGE